jgi:hypothetical protein
MTCKKYFLKTAFLTLLIFSFSGCENEDRKLEERTAELDSLSAELTRQQQTIDSLQSLMENSEIAAGYPVFFGRKFDTIENPKEYISNSLKQQKNLIPLDAVLGGTMDFRKVDVLTEDWVLAIYDDGHIQGKSIYEYELQEDGEVRFREVISKLPDSR